MKVKTISRSAVDHTRERAGDVFKVQRNLDPNLHPFEKGREYVRAVNAAKVERMMAKPFLGALSGHTDGVYCMAKHPTVLDRVYSGSADGEIRVWNLSGRKTTHTLSKAHSGIVRGLTAVPDSNQFISCGIDRTVKIWSTDATDEHPDVRTPVSTFIGKYAFNSIDHHRRQPCFATAGVVVDLWDHTRSHPIQSYSWGTDTVSAVRFNPTETSVFASTATDRAIVLYDVRSPQPLKKLVLELVTNNVCWNPMEPFQFAAANEDHNVYLFDMRRMDRAANILKDHVSAVLDVDYSPTGRELVTGAYDKTLRLFDVKQGHSRDVYHTKRMQRLWCVRFSMDAKYVMSASDDGNIRLWKANAAEKVGIVGSREAASMRAAEALRNKYAHMPGVRKVAKHRIVPKAIKGAAQLKRTMLDARARKDENVRKHAKNPDQLRPRIPERDKHVVGTQD